MILRYPRKARIRLVSLRNMRQRWARPRTARPWYRWHWREAKCRSYWRCGCFFPRVGRASDEAWLIGERRMSGENKYYLANLPAKTNLRTLATTIKARWVCEQAHQQMKEE